MKNKKLLQMLAVVAGITLLSACSPSGGFGCFSGSDSLAPPLIGLEDDSDTVFDLFDEDSVTSSSFDVKINKIKDPNKHKNFTGTPPDKLTMKRNADGSLTVSGAKPFVDVTGTLDDNGFVLKGSGTIAGFPDVPATLTGVLDDDGGFSATLQWGGDTGPLPGGPISFELSGELNSEK